MQGYKTNKNRNINFTTYKIRLKRITLMRSQSPLLGHGNWTRSCCCAISAFKLLIIFLNGSPADYKGKLQTLKSQFLTSDLQRNPFKILVYYLYKGNRNQKIPMRTAMKQRTPHRAQVRVAHTGHHSCRRPGLKWEFCFGGIYAPPGESLVQGIVSDLPRGVIAERLIVTRGLSQSLMQQAHPGVRNFTATGTGQSSSQAFSIK